MASDEAASGVAIDQGKIRTQRHLLFGATKAKSELQEASAAPDIHSCDWSLSMELKAKEVVLPRVEGVMRKDWTLYLYMFVRHEAPSLTHPKNNVFHLHLIDPKWFLCYHLLVWLANEVQSLHISKVEISLRYTFSQVLSSQPVLSNISASVRFVLYVS